MATVKKVPQCFQTSDGKEHATEADAEAHQRLIDATNDLADAQKRLWSAMAENQRTADGERFEFGGMRDYWYVRAFMGDAHTERVSFFGAWHTEFRVDEQGDVFIANRNDGRREEARQYRIRDLFARERNAVKLVIERRKEDLRHKQEEIKKMERQYAK